MSGGTRTGARCVTCIQGVTLTELVVVLAILGIMALLAYPALTGSLDELYLRQTARHLTQDIRFVQQQAMNNPAGGWKMSLIFSQVVNGQHVATQGWTVRRFVDGNSAVHKACMLPPGIAFLGTNFASREIRFSELGVPLSAGYVGLCDRAGHKLYVIVGAVTGKTRIDTKPPGK